MAKVGLWWWRVGAHALVDARQIEALLMPEEPIVLLQMDSAGAGQGSKYRRSISRFNESPSNAALAVLRE